MKYIRLKDGRIFNINNIYYKEEFDAYYDEEHFKAFQQDDINWFLISHLFFTSDILKQVDTIEESMMVGDLVFKKNGDIFVIANQAYIDYYIENKSVSKLFIEDNKGNYIKVAEENDKGELELL